MDLRAYFAANKTSIIFLLSGIVLIGLGFLYPKLNLIQNSVAPEFKKASVAIDLGGAVKEPGVYHLTEPLRLEEVVKKAGGFTEGADLDWVAKNLNLASAVKDEMKVYIPKKGELMAKTGQNASLEKSSNQVLGVTSWVNINTANEAELDQLPAVGAVTAQKIITGRPYQSINELLNRKIVPKATFEKIKGMVKSE